MATISKTTSSGKQTTARKAAAVAAETAVATETAAAPKNTGRKPRKPAAGSGRSAVKKAVPSGTRTKQAAPAGAKRAVKKAAPKKAAPKKAAPKKAASARTRKADAAPPISPEQRLELIAKTAYYLAEKRGFEGGDPEVDWFEAEAQVDAILAQRGAPAAEPPA